MSFFNFDDVEIEEKNEWGDLDCRNGTLLDFAIHEAVSKRYWGSTEIELNIFSELFCGGKILRVWNEYPHYRQTIYSNFVIAKSRPRKISEEEESDLKGSLQIIAEKVCSLLDGKKDEHSASMFEQLSYAGYHNKQPDVMGNLRSLENEQDSSDFAYWIDKFLSKKREADEYEEVYFSIKRFPGSTKIKGAIIKAAVEHDSLSEKIMERVAKSSPISLKRRVVNGLCVRINQLEKAIFFKSSGASYYKDLVVEDTKKEIANIREKLILFAPVEDYRIQDRLISALEPSQLVWLVPAVSNLSNSWLSDILNRKMQ